LVSIFLVRVIKDNEIASAAITPIRKAANIFPEKSVIELFAT
jgi:hypothetical protein